MLRIHHSLIDEYLLHTQVVVQWQSTEGHDRPYKATKEIVMFLSFVERDLAFPTSDFFWGLLFHRGIQPYHLNLNSILHISIFVHLVKHV